MAYSHTSNEESFDKMRDMCGPALIDKQIRQAIQFCWMGLPKDKRNVDELERQIRRLVDRALRDVREDFDEFFSDKKDCPCATHNPLASPVERRDALYQSVRFEDFLSITRQSSRRS
jgi:uncharacterized protein with von Willebrand factor type A (vWA) domain